MKIPPWPAAGWECRDRHLSTDLHTGIISTVAGSGVAGEEGDDGPASKALLINPHALLLEADKSLIIASAVSSKLRWVDLRKNQIHAVPLAKDVSKTLVFYGVTRWKGGLALASPRPGSVEFLKDGQLTRLFGKPGVVFPRMLPFPQRAISILRNWAQSCVEVGWFQSTNSRRESGASPFHRV